MRLALQSCIEHLDRLERRMHEGIQEIQEIRNLFMDLLDNYQSDVAMGDSGRYNSTINSQAGLDRLNAIQPSISSHDRCFVPQPAPHRTSYGVMGSLSQGTGLPQGRLLRSGSADYMPTAQPSLVRPQHNMYCEKFSAFYDPRVMAEGTDPHLSRLLQALDSSLCGTSDPVHEPGVQPFQGIEHVPSSPLAKPDEQLPVPTVQFSQVKDKVKCLRHGCSALVNKDNLPRHIAEVHERKIKVVCVGCGREFKRSYQLNEHILRSGCGRS
ncbi:hypothetical protein BD769DRAFT_1689703 [Suillus cothurnatus]|nr:hypothetical protein BD769DRAFT_1689703 [Suillus cothurnatus]